MLTLFTCSDVMFYLSFKDSNCIFVSKSLIAIIANFIYYFQSYIDRIQNGKALIQKVFGPKFDRKFPTYRRPKKADCSEGVWPTTTNDHYQTTGVDLTLKSGDNVRTYFLFIITHE